MSEKRVSKLITSKEDIDKFLNIDENTLMKKSFIMDTFGDFNNKNKYHPYDIIEIPPGYYGPEGNKNINKFKTTLGLWFFNKGFIEKDFFNVFGYINVSLTDKELEKISDRLAYALIEDKINLSQLKLYFKKQQKYMPFVSILSPGYTMNMLLITKQINKRKFELMKKYDKELKSGNEHIVSEIQDNLMAYSKELLKDDPSMDIYNSGARGKFNNQFKNMFIMKGLCKDPDPNKGYNIIMSNQMDGVTKEEYSKLANALAAGPYSRGKKTQVGGYWEKLFLSAYQYLVLGPKGSDCGTKRTIKVFLTESNINFYMYSYIVDNGRLVELTSDVKDKYLNKTVNFRFSSLCEMKDGFCNKCAGNLFYRLGIKNVGITTPQIASKLKLISMKAFHDSQARFSEMDPMKAFGYKE